VSKAEPETKTERYSLMSDGHSTGRRLDQLLADQRAKDIAPIIRQIETALRQAKKPITLNAIAEGLNVRRVSTPRDGNQWHPMQVKRLLARLP
jgi:hypothetical protein